MFCDCVIQYPKAQTDEWFVCRDETHKDVVDSMVTFLAKSLLKHGSEAFETARENMKRNSRVKI